MENLDVKTINYILAAVAAVVYVGILCWIPFRIKHLKNECGEKLMELKADFPFRSVAIFVVCGALIGVVPVRNFAPYLAAVFLATALIGEWMAAKQAANSGINGIFENMIISDTTAIRYDEILSLPTVAYENDEDTDQVDFTVLEVLPEHGAKIYLLFPDEEVRNKALKVILQQCPRLGD